MTNNSFSYYQQLRAHYLHCIRLSNPQSSVPSHIANVPRSRIAQDRLGQRQKQIIGIQAANQKIMHKLVAINRRKNHTSLPNISLKKKRLIPMYEEANDFIAQKLITIQPTIKTTAQLKQYKACENMKRNLSRFSSHKGYIQDRKKLVAQYMLQKQLKNSEIAKSRISYR